MSSSVVETLRAVCGLTQTFSCSVALMWKVHARYATVISLCLEQLDICHLFFVCLLLQKSITMSLVQNSLGKLFLLSCGGGCRIQKQGAPCNMLAFQMSLPTFAHLMVLQKHTEMAPAMTIKVGVYSFSSSLEGVYFSISLDFHLV